MSEPTASKIEDIASDAESDRVDDAAADTPSSAADGEKKKRKKKSKGKKVADKIKSALPGGEKEIPGAILNRVMEDVNKLPEAEREHLNEDEVRKALQAMKLMDMLKNESQGLSVTGKNKKDLGEHKFWKTQPVPQYLENGQEPLKDGPIDPPKQVSELRQTPYPLPKDFEWSTVDVDDQNQLKEVYDLLSANYVEDEDATMRFNYSAEFLDWALKPPGWVASWHVGVRVSSTKKLVAFISGIPIKLDVRGNQFNSSEINFLCVHKKLRSKRLAPVLIKEVTRRCNLEQVWQAIYTAGVVLPTPIGTSRYFHRNLNPQKLIAINFAILPRNMTMARCIKHYSVPTQPQIPGWREMEEKDLSQVGALLRRYLARFQVAPVYDDDELRHWLLSGKGVGEKVGGKRDKQVTWAYVVENPETHQITDVMSFYSLPSTVIKSTQYPILNAAYTFYYATDVAFASASSPAEGSSSSAIVSRSDRRDVLADRLKALMGDLLTEAKNADFDVVNSLTGLDNNSFLAHHKFGPGDGYLNYYLYNWRTPTVTGGYPDDRSGTSEIVVNLGYLDELFIPF
ncbi:n-myristoyl transferase [Phaffia rhodozyma]|uniref:Glycylpeptide N-tetradecanoyltransferase n=1 Tax=Phaffia rhodozyma TaxID=264483 RepID=A0A0F7SRB5_PHARH|nr:n-myristoyl transferase [Phaffia rhodozyma]